MPGILISFRDFLKTGHFGPITPDLCLLDVANTLGAPDSFLTKHAENIPTYWRYGKFEIDFLVEVPHKIRFYQIEWASYLEGQYELIKNDIVLLLEGLHGSTKPSEFLLAGLWDTENVTVNVGAMSDDIKLNICAGLVRIVFEINASFIENGDAEKYLTDTSITEIIKTIDDRTEVNSILVDLSETEAAANSQHGHSRHVSGRQYLDDLHS